MAVKLGKPMQPKARKSLAEILQAERNRKTATPAPQPQELTRVECKSCGNVKHGHPGNQYCTYCDGEEYHRAI